MRVTTAQYVKSWKENGGILRLALGDASNIRKQTKAIETCFHNDVGESRLTSIVVTDFPGSSPLRRGVALCGLLDSIGKIESIRQVGFERIGINTPTVAMLSKLLWQVGNRLEVLTISDIDIVVPNGPDRIDDLAGAMKHLHCLRTCNLSNIVVKEEESRNAIEISSIFQAISKLPMLVELRVEPARNGLGRVTGNLLERSLRSLDGLVVDKLQTLRLGEIPINSPWLEKFSQTLGANKSLEKISISFCFLSTSTESSKLAFLADALRVNTALKSINLRFCMLVECPELKPFLLQLAKAIAQNEKSSITDLSIVGRDAELSLVEDAMVESLKTNCTLTSLNLRVVSPRKDDLARGNKTTEIQMYLRLNAFGRKELFGRQGSRKTWVDTIARMTPTNDLDCIFYCLQMNPSLCQVASPSSDPSSESSNGNNKRRLASDQSDMGEDSKKMKLAVEEMQHKHAMEMEEMQKKHARLEEEIERLKSSHK